MDEHSMLISMCIALAVKAGMTPKEFVQAYSDQGKNIKFRKEMLMAGIELMGDEQKEALSKLKEELLKTDN